MIEALGARVHLFVQPAHREPFTALFRDTLQCEVHERDFGMSEPILLVRFPDGSAFSVEFTDLAPAPPPAVHRRLDEAGIPSFSHPPSPHRYFSAPGGQVFRILDMDYAGP